MSEPLLGKRGRRWLFVLGVIGGLVVVLVIYAIVAAAVNSTETNKRGESRESQVQANDETLAIIKDCTQVGGKCYERGQRNTANILASAQQIIIFAAACSVDVDPSQTVDERIAAISSCVTKRLTSPPKKP